jgi:hypothetical protein
MSNTPLTQVVRLHRDYWLKRKGFKDIVPILNIVIVNVHPTKQDAIPWIANPRPEYRPVLENIAVFIPITCPWVLSKGPPELPGFNTDFMYKCMLQIEMQSLLIVY